MMGGRPFRVWAGDRIDLVLAASVTTGIEADVRIDFDDGSQATIPFEFAHPDGTRTINRREGLTIGQDGWVTGAIAATRVGGVERGEIYALLEAHGADLRIRHILARGYVYESHAISLGEQIEPGPEGGRGFIRTVTGTNPDAGAEVSEAVPSDAIWRLLAFGVVMAVDTASAGITAPVSLVVDDGAVTARKAIFKNSNTQAANTTRTWFWGPTDMMGGQIVTTSLADTQTVLYENSIGKELFLVEGDRIRTITPGIDPQDDYAAPIFQVEEWIVA